mmetsp:Transcript_67830/g.189343  ORF Transcript_67830/g.189343 Transcript_67830/m.189343 type:complete len:535 (-) Transcript_67830:403-2007(-)
MEPALFKLMMPCLLQALICACDTLAGGSLAAHTSRHLRMSAQSPDGTRCDLPRLNGSTLTRADFRSIWTGTPVIITDALRTRKDNASAFLPWTRTAFSAQFGANRVGINNGRFDRRRLENTVTVDEVLAADEAHGFVIFSSDRIGHHVGARTVLDAYHELEHALPPFLDEFNARRILSVGMRAGSTRFHIHDETWLALLAGAKAWWIAPSSYTSADLLVDEPCGLLGNSTFVPELPEDLLFCIQRPGEIVYFGDEQTHATCNLEPFTLGIGAQGHTEHWPSLVRAAHSGNFAAAHALLGEMRVGDVNAHVLSDQDFGGQTALHHAIQIGNVGLVAELIRRRALATPAGPQRMHPLHVAAQFGHTSLVDLLASEGTSVAVSDQQDRQPMHYASINGHVAAVKALVSQRASATVMTKYGQRPLHIAAHYGHAAVVEVLTGFGAQVSSATMQGHLEQPMHVAASSGKTAVVSLLANLGASISATSAQGFQPLHLAGSNGHAAAAALTATVRRRLSLFCVAAAHRCPRFTTVRLVTTE